MTIGYSHGPNGTCRRSTVTLEIMLIDKALSVLARMDVDSSDSEESEKMAMLTKGSDSYQCHQLEFGLQCVERVGLGITMDMRVGLSMGVSRRSQNIRNGRRKISRLKSKAFRMQFTFFTH